MLRDFFMLKIWLQAPCFFMTDFKSSSVLQAPCSMLLL
jgi:hypothetical protein